MSSAEENQEPNQKHSNLVTLKVDRRRQWPKQKPKHTHTHTQSEHEYEERAANERIKLG